jgi:hypothetical protein
LRQGEIDEEAREVVILAVEEPTPRGTTPIDDGGQNSRALRPPHRARHAVTGEGQFPGHFDLGDGPDGLELDALEAGLTHAHPELAADTTFPTTIDEWARALHVESTREVSPDELAEVLNAVRTPGLAQAGESFDAAHDRATDDRLQAFVKGLGLTDEQWQQTQEVSQRKGWILPSASSIGTLLTYATPAILRYGFNITNPWHHVAGSAIMSGIVHPIVSTIAQTPIVAALDTSQSKNGHLMVVDKSVNAAESPDQIAAKLALLAEELDQEDVKCQEVFRGIAAEYEMPVPAGRIPDAQVIHLVDKIRHDTDEARKETCGRQILDVGMAYLDLRVQEKALADKLRMASGVQQRMKDSTMRQFWPRVARAASPMIGTLIRGIGHAKHKDLSTPATAVALGVALIALGAQHWKSGADERDGGMHNDVKLNMLFGREFLKEAGKEAFDKGDPIMPEHIDVDKARDLAPGPATQMLRLVIKQLDRQLESPALTVAQRTSLVQERELLANALGDPNELLTLSHDGEARRLLNQVMGSGHPWAFAATEGWNKITGPMEFTVQGVKRFAAAWRMGIFGNVGITTTGRVPIAAAGGGDRADFWMQAAAQFLLGVGPGAYLALNQYDLDNIKNKRRADESSAIQQFGTSTFDLRWQSKQNQITRETLGAVGKTRQSDRLAKVARDKLMPAPEVPLAEDPYARNIGSETAESSTGMTPVHPGESSVGQAGSVAGSRASLRAARRHAESRRLDGGGDS